MKLIVCGGRHWNDRRKTFAALDAVHRKRPITLIIEGGCDGADLLSRAWCLSRGVEYLEIPADWDNLGKRAGPVRNRLMLAEKPDGVMALPGNNGTADMINAARAAGVTVWMPYG